MRISSSVFPMSPQRASYYYPPSYLYLSLLSLLFCSLLGLLWMNSEVFLTCWPRKVKMVHCCARTLYVLVRGPKLGVDGLICLVLRFFHFSFLTSAPFFSQFGTNHRQSIVHRFYQTRCTIVSSRFNVGRDELASWTLRDILNEDYLASSTPGAIPDTFKSPGEWRTTFVPFILEEVRHALCDCLVNLVEGQSIRCEVNDVRAASDTNVDIQFREEIIQPHLKAAEKDIKKGVSLYCTYVLLVRQEGLCPSYDFSLKIFALTLVL